MAIEVLPPQLANQIAAGEVVERPASVIKELVENSIDAGASRIDIEIDKGGSKLIRIRDNGSGIAKEQLGLALSRHATSKLHTLDDLDAIMSFGFRGEALASISSVSRLTITSRPAEQSEAWQAYAEGSQMAVKVNPAAHPVGTTIEAVDLFFNTPARRRFLKSDKTEFTHIDEWLKRIAIVQPSIHFTLQHNGKMVRNYRPAATQIQFVQRLSQISSRSFAENALHIECQHEGLRLTGYMQAPQQLDSSAHLDVHYFYVNGRLVRDRLVNHAVRQAFSYGSERSSDAKLPCYVLMLDLDPHQVDVNVHPAKHEVRFHQARYIHDYILQALQSAITAANELPLNNVEPLDEKLSSQELCLRKAGDGTNSIAHSIKESSALTDRLHSSAQRPGESVEGSPLSVASDEHFNVREESLLNPSEIRSYSSGGGLQQYGRPQASSQTAIDSYCELVKPQPQVLSSFSPNEAHIEHQSPMPPLLEGKWWVLAANNDLQVLALENVAVKVKEHEIASRWENGLVSQPLLMPVSISLDADWSETVAQYEVLLRQMGLELTIRYQQLIIKKVPPYLRNAQIATRIPELLQWLRFDKPEKAALIGWLAEHSVKGFTQAEEIWRSLNCLPEHQRNEIKAHAISLPWQSWLKEQHSDKH